MRNFKKILSLVLCMAMMLSVMVVGAGAAFSDQSKINNAEAVDACAALNIINGYTDGSFRPEGTITRAEACKMICVALNGGKEPTLGTSAKSSFTDTKGHWAEGYIESCVAQGIVAGIGGGKFNPNGNVTGTQFAKMLLIALGYNSDNEGYVGAAWEVEVNVDASAKGLYADLSGMDPSKALSRDNAAQMVWNALNAYEVEYKYNLVSENGQLVSKLVLQDKVGLDGKTKVTLLEDKYEAQTFTGTFEGNADSLGIDDGMIQVYGSVNSDKADRDANFPYDLSLQYIGEEVKVLFKDGKGGTEDAPDKHDTIYGVYVTGNTKVINAILDDIDDTPDGKKVKIDGVKYECAPLEKGDVYAIINYGAGNDKDTEVSENTANDAEKTAGLFAGLSAQSGSPVKFVCNDDGKIVKAYIVNSTINKVNAVSSTKVTLNVIGGLEKEDHNIYSGAAKDDIVIATKLYSDETYTVEKAETITGTLDGFVTDGGKTTKVTIDGTVYLVDVNGLKNLSDDCTTKVEDSDIDSKVTAYMINGMIGALEVEEGASNWAVVAAKNGDDVLEGTFEALKVKLITSDGTEIIAKVHEDSKASADAAEGSLKNTDLAKGDLVKYVQTSEDVVKIKEIATYNYTAAEGAKIYDKDTKSLYTSANTSMVVASDAPAYITNADGDIKVYTLRDLKSITAPAVVGEEVTYTVNYATDDGKVIAAFIDLNARPTGSAADTVYGEVTAVNGTKKVDGDYYNAYVVTCNDKDYTVYTNKTLVKKDLVSFDPTSDDIYGVNDIKVYSGEFAANAVKAVWVKEYDEGETLTYYSVAPTLSDGVYVGNDAYLKTDAVDDDVVVTYVNLDDAADAGDAIGVNEFSATTGYANALVVYDTDGKTIIAIFVETSDEVSMGTVVTN